MNATQVNSTDPAILHQQRDKRLRDAIALQVPDQVPVVYWSVFWHARHAGYTVRQAMYDPQLNADAARAAAIEFQPDGIMASFMVTAIGHALELLDYVPLQWAGHGVGENRSYQYLDREFMKPDEYDVFIEDPSYFHLTRYLPRVYRNLEALAKIPQLTSFQHVFIIPALRAFAEPDVVQALQRMSAVGAAGQQMLQQMTALGKELTSLGFPLLRGGMSMAPFDYFADYLRGSKGIMLDLYRCKDKLMEAMDRITPALIRPAIASGKAGGSNVIFIPIHWGVDGFMSQQQFKTFFWPQLRKVIVGLIDGGMVPCVLWEGDCTSRLETIADIPRGKAIYWFERTNMFRAKEVLGDVVCLRGNIPPSMFNTGTPDDITGYVRQLIEKVGKGGGLIVDGAIGIPDEARPQNVTAMFEAVRKYGVSS